MIWTIKNTEKSSFRKKFVYITRPCPFKDRIICSGELHLLLYSILRQDLFDQLLDTDRFNVANVYLKELCPLLLFGNRNLDTVANRTILEATISFIKASAMLN